MNKKVLIVEDEAHIGIGIKFNCEAEGLEATLVEDGPSALKLIADEPDEFCAVILDIMLPDMSGYAVLEEIRARGIQIPVLILSARTLTEDKVRGFDAGADQYLTKPFELPELISRVKSLVNRRKPEPAALPTPDVFTFGNARIDFKRHEVTVDGELLELTTKELDLLRFFVAREGQVLSRGDLLDNVWGVDSSPITRTVDNFIVRLRRYFEIDPANPQHFLSVRGVGYRFVADPNGEENEESKTEDDKNE
ncbi:Sensory transduction protein regX3 [Symmachiella macrocystis]|uniref:Sensory transduction protein regX3 n=1 Tax=Symmachiella macrocystis TaxID=2527985 RepID=A0A5C6BSD0_9PLAN|nr:response regulator transcription factor [Symmachiella macrocystis]TWU14632.1 Sensory transduction protein regX3 [Symmachiella macrocystis]